MRVAVRTLNHQALHDSPGHLNCIVVAEVLEMRDLIAKKALHSEELCDTIGVTAMELKPLATDLQVICRAAENTSAAADSL